MEHLWQGVDLPRQDWIDDTIERDVADCGCSQPVAVNNKDEWIQRDGHQTLQRLAQALQIRGLQDSEQLIGQTLVVEHDAHGCIVFSSAEGAAA